MTRNHEQNDSTTASQNAASGLSRRGRGYRPGQTSAAASLTTVRWREAVSAGLTVMSEPGWQPLAASGEPLITVEEAEERSLAVRRRFPANAHAIGMTVDGARSASGRRSSLRTRLRRALLALHAAHGWEVQLNDEVLAARAPDTERVVELVADFTAKGHLRVDGRFGCCDTGPFAPEEVFAFADQMLAEHVPTVVYSPDPLDEDARYYAEMLRAGPVDEHELRRWEHDLQLEELGPWRVAVHYDRTDPALDEWLGAKMPMPELLRWADALGVCVPEIEPDWAATRLFVEEVCAFREQHGWIPDLDGCETVYVDVGNNFVKSVYTALGLTRTWPNDDERLGLSGSLMCLSAARRFGRCTPDELDKHGVVVLRDRAGTEWELKTDIYTWRLTRRRREDRLLGDCGSTLSASAAATLLETVGVAAEVARLLAEYLDHQTTRSTERAAGVTWGLVPTRQLLRALPGGEEELARVRRPGRVDAGLEEMTEPGWQPLAASGLPLMSVADATRTSLVARGRFPSNARAIGMSLTWQRTGGRHSDPARVRIEHALRALHEVYGWRVVLNGTTLAPGASTAAIRVSVNGGFDDAGDVLLDDDHQPLESFSMESSGALDDDEARALQQVMHAASIPVVLGVSDEAGVSVHMHLATAPPRDERELCLVELVGYERGIDYANCGWTATDLLRWADALGVPPHEVSPLWTTTRIDVTEIAAWRHRYGSVPALPMESRPPETYWAGDASLDKNTGEWGLPAGLASFVIERFIGANYAAIRRWDDNGVGLSGYADESERVSSAPARGSYPINGWFIDEVGTDRWLIATTYLAESVPALRGDHAALPFGRDAMRLLLDRAVCHCGEGVHIDDGRLVVTADDEPAAGADLTAA